MRMGRGQVNAKGANMAMIARMISQQMGRDVIDKTGLAGPYDLNLEWTPEPGQRWTSASWGATARRFHRTDAGGGGGGE